MFNVEFGCGYFYFVTLCVTRCKNEFLVHIFTSSFLFKKNNLEIQSGKWLLLPFDLSNCVQIEFSYCSCLQNMFIFRSSYSRCKYYRFSSYRFYWIYEKVYKSLD